MPVREDDPARAVPLVVAIDGPSGSGKSTVARAVAEHLGLRYLDTGAMYRAVAWKALEERIDLADTAAVAALARRLHLELSDDPAVPRVVADGHDVTAAIRESRVSESVSAVATNLAVRAELVRRQRATVADAAPGIVAEGRDTTTVVAPTAQVRVLLTADAGERVARRAREVHGRADAAALAATTAQVLHRDERDATVVQFHEAAEGVIRLDSSALDLADTVQAVLEIVAARTGRPTGAARPATAPAADPG